MSGLPDLALEHGRKRSSYESESHRADMDLCSWIPTEAQADDILADQAERRGQEDTKFLDEKMADEARTDAESLAAGRAGDEERVDGSV